MDILVILHKMGFNEGLALQVDLLPDRLHLKKAKLISSISTGQLRQELEDERAVARHAKESLVSVEAKLQEAEQECSKLRSQPRRFATLGEHTRVSTRYYAALHQMGQARPRPAPLPPFRIPERERRRRTPLPRGARSRRRPTKRGRPPRTFGSTQSRC